MKAKLHGGVEWDVFSRKARRLVHMNHRTIRWIKRKFWKRERKAARIKIRKDVDNETFRI